MGRRKQPNSDQRSGRLRRLHVQEEEANSAETFRKNGDLPSALQLRAPHSLAGEGLSPKIGPVLSDRAGEHAQLRRGT